MGKRRFLELHLSTKDQKPSVCGLSEQHCGTRPGFCHQHSPASAGSFPLKLSDSLASALAIRVKIVTFLSVFLSVVIAVLPVTELSG
jgi:hypothetical protein